MDVDNDNKRKREEHEDDDVHKKKVALSKDSHTVQHNMSPIPEHNDTLKDILYCQLCSSEQVGSSQDDDDNSVNENENENDKENGNDAKMDAMVDSDFPTLPKRKLPPKSTDCCSGAIEISDGSSICVVSKY
jgi:hypothetical protein